MAERGKEFLGVEYGGALVDNHDHARPPKARFNARRKRRIPYPTSCRPAAWQYNATTCWASRVKPTRPRTIASERPQGERSSNHPSFYSWNPAFSIHQRGRYASEVCQASGHAFVLTNAKTAFAGGSVGSTWRMKLTVSLASAIPSSSAFAR